MGANFLENNQYDISFSKRILKINGEKWNVLQLIKVTVCCVTELEFQRQQKFLL